MKAIIATLVIGGILLCASTTQAQLFGCRKRACCNTTCQPQQTFKIRDLSEGKAEVDVTIQWRRFTITERVYSDIDITKDGIVIQGTAYTRRGVPINSYIIIPWEDIKKELNDINLKKELLEVLLKHF